MQNKSIQGHAKICTKTLTFFARSLWMDMPLYHQEGQGDHQDYSHNPPGEIQLYYNLNSLECLTPPKKISNQCPDMLGQVLSQGATEGRF